MPQPPKELGEFSALVKIVEDLRGPDGCPWDKEQSHKTLTQYAIEEVYEFVEAIDSGEQNAIIEELGDLLLQVVLHSEIAKQSNTFSIKEVIQSISSKMIRRHPHVFSHTVVHSSEEVVENWQKIKTEEKNSKQISNFGIPVNMPSLIRSQKIGNKTKNYNFDWSNASEVLPKIEEEWGELKEAISSGSLEEQQNELGDLLFSVAQLARHLNFDAEQSLRKTNRRFENRFFRMLTNLENQNKKIHDISKDELEIAWKKAKS
jgi:tetrapyrrole methylase family protein/MazG family protein